jgi:hypothetical protein
MLGLRAGWWEPKRREASSFGDHLPGSPELPGIFFAQLVYTKPEDSRFSFCGNKALQRLRFDLSQGSRSLCLFSIVVD